MRTYVKEYRLSKIVSPFYHPPIVIISRVPDISCMSLYRARFLLHIHQLPVASSNPLTSTPFVRPQNYCTSNHVGFIIAAVTSQGSIKSVILVEQRARRGYDRGPSVLQRPSARVGRGRAGWVGWSVCVAVWGDGWLGRWEVGG